mmetsp:Transcript_15628/g.39050  ORF Transcript_15628/g.39050 Transcript_15628/m.39050 type:complete len:129 (+) Transcript_15628:3-389(+)
MEGLFQKHFVHQLRRGSSRESAARVNATFRWIARHASSCPLYEPCSSDDDENKIGPPSELETESSEEEQEDGDEDEDEEDNEMAFAKGEEADASVLGSSGEVCAGLAADEVESVVPDVDADQAAIVYQ